MRKSLKISVKNLMWLIIINLAFLQNALLSITPFFRYFDELVTLFFVVFIALNMRRLSKEHIRIFACLFAVIILGLIGNLSSDVGRTTRGIVLDILYFAKIYICLVGSSLYFQKKGGIRDISRTLSVELHVFITVGLLLAIVSQFSNIGMTHGYRFGFRAFQYIYSSPGMLSQYCIFFLIILTIDLENKGSKIYKYFHILLLFALWLSSGRTRGIAVMLVWFFFITITNTKAYNDDSYIDARSRVRKLMKPRYIVFAVTAILFIGWDQIQYYLGSESTAARSLLLRGGITIMRDYFPFGAGFATFGTEMAATDYSPLYYRYGLNTHWALTEGGGELTDCFWPAVGAEFGLIGLIMMVALVWLLSKQLIHESRNHKYCLIASITYVIYLLISSTATSIYTAYTSTLFVAVFIGMFIDKRTEG